MSQMIDYLAAYKTYSRHNYFFHNFIYEFDPKTIDFDRFDVVMLPHNFWPMNLNEEQRAALAATKALKALFLQDEYQEVRNINKVMDEMGIDLMFTCVAEKDFDVFYPKKRIKSLQAVYGVLTGYVSDAMMAPDMLQLENKTIDVGFRSRVSPDFLGKLGYEKLRIAEKFGAFATEQGLSTNISVNEDDRLSGHRWTEFLQSCKTQLGTPSGSSVIDFDGKLMKTSTSYRRAFPHVPFHEVFDANLARYDGKYGIDTVSPRTFECAATGTAMVQLEGYCGGILTPGKHYIEIKADYSNMGDVVEQIKDTRHCQTIAKQAHADLIASNKYNFRTHVEKIDDIFDYHLPNAKARSTFLDPKAFYNQIIWRHDQSFTMGDGGLIYLNTFKAEKLQEAEQQNTKLRKVPIIGKMVNRTGGEPIKKVAKGKAALQLVRTFPVFRSLFLRAIMSGKNGPRLEVILKDILLLGIIKSVQSGLNLSGTGFGARLQLEDEKIVLIGDPKFSLQEPDEAFFEKRNPGDKVPRKDVREQLNEYLQYENGQIVVDLASVFPLAVFASSIIFYWPLEARPDSFRSNADLYYHLPGFTQISKSFPLLSKQVINEALTPASASELNALTLIFENKKE
ncbi:MAG: glycosyltransferase family 1 protein [Robiginitomaculum sp.]|nr:glycosyltransferase family 1 protein [Robiginitomaculum sp.]